VTQDRDPGPSDTAASDTAGDEPLSEAFWSVARKLRATDTETLGPWDITPAQLRALRALKRHGMMRLSELSDHLHIAPRSVTEVVDALESRDLVRRRADSGDRRATLVELTEHGVSTLEAIRAARDSEAERTFDRLSQDDRVQLARILRKLQDLSDPAPKVTVGKYRPRRASGALAWCGPGGNRASSAAGGLPAAPGPPRKKRAR
jgi:DNA-binding MarR family transcriptional regulator